MGSNRIKTGLDTSRVLPVPITLRVAYSAKQTKLFIRCTAAHHE